MKKFQKIVAFTALWIACLLSVQAQQQIASDYAPHTDFTPYKTYSWQKISAPDDAWENSIKSTIDAQLAKKGWIKVASGGDAALCAITSSGEAAMMEHFYGGMGPGWRWRGWSEPVPYNQGTLIVDIFDAKTQALIWRGFISESVSKKEPQQINKLDGAVGKLFKDFPPKN